MSTLVIATPRHIKVRDEGGSFLLERCEDGGCVVHEDGHAECGRIACPSCGCSGGNLTVGDADEPIFCRCGHSWIPAW